VLEPETALAALDPAALEPAIPLAVLEPEALAPDSPPEELADDDDVGASPVPLPPQEAREVQTRITPKACEGSGRMSTG
jgi:hypothetical protein